MQVINFFKFIFQGLPCNEADDSFAQTDLGSIEFLLKTFYQLTFRIKYLTSTTCIKITQTISPLV
jgi:hypothetical protein